MKHIYIDILSCLLLLNAAITPIFGSNEQEKPPHKKRRLNITCHQRTAPLLPQNPYNPHKETEILNNPYHEIDLLEKSFLNMFFGEKNGTQEFVSAIKKTENARDKKDAIFSLLSNKNLEDLSLKKLENIILAIKTLPSKELRELFYSLEEEFGERMLYNFVTQHTITSDYQKNEIIEKAILEAVIKACCPESNETVLMTQHRLYLIKSLIKGFTTAPNCVLEEATHKQYFELLSQLEPEEHASLLPGIMKHIGKYIKDLPSNDNQVECQHYSLEVIYHCLNDLSFNNPNLIEDWVSKKWLKNFLRRIEKFYSKKTCAHLVEILGPELPESPSTFAQYLQEKSLVKTKIAQMVIRFPLLFKPFNQKFKNKKIQLNNIFANFKNNDFSDIQIYYGQ